MKPDLIIYRVTSVDKNLGKLVEKIWQNRKRVLILVPSEEQALFIDQLLWTYSPLAFLPHGCKGQDLHPQDHPLWITTSLESHNNAEVLILLESYPLEILPSSFEKVLMIAATFQPSLLEKLCNQARQCTFWQQTATGWKSMESLREFIKL